MTEIEQAASALPDTSLTAIIWKQHGGPTLDWAASTPTYSVSQSSLTESELSWHFEMKAQKYVLRAVFLLRFQFSFMPTTESKRVGEEYVFSLASTQRETFIKDGMAWELI